ncbi:MAG: glycosyl hydrolase-related protein, partial [Acutalibacteraceae bacterium]|nr:glycosyl hydrolase-related protein [Acutalibacteraceae bacterium]
NFIDMSEDDYGLSILNDCKYGYEVNEQRMIITLLKAPMNPDPKSDRGDHYFTYSIYPHAGNWKNAETLVRGLEMNNPAVAVEINGDAKGEDAKSFIKVDGKNVTLEAVKKCEDEDAYIIRFVEKAGSRTKVSAELFAEIASVAECDLLERNDVAVDIANGKTLNFEINPFEIKCYKVKMK